MWPDLAIDRGLSLTQRLLKRIQTFHDFIGLDSRLLSESERLNERAMYRIYQDKTLPELDDGLDDIAAHQRGVALLQRNQEQGPELWEIITQLPDGIRSAVKVSSVDVVDVEADRFIQAAMEIDAAQMPLMSPSSQIGAISPLDNPGPGETLVLFESGDTTESYAVGNDTSARSITSSQLISAMECPPGAPGKRRVDALSSVPFTIVTMVGSRNPVVLRIRIWLRTAQPAEIASGAKRTWHGVLGD